MQELKKHGPGTITSVSLSEEINDIMKIIQVIGDSDILLKGVTETIENKTNKQEMGFLGTLVGTLGSISLGIILSWKSFVRAGPGNNKGKKIVRAADGKKKGIFDAASSFSKLWDKSALSKWTKI